MATSTSDSVSTVSTDFTVLQMGRCIQYTIPSFPVLTVAIREVSLQWEDENCEVHLFDGFMRESELLTKHRLPAVAQVPVGHKHAFFAKVRTLSIYVT